jgi:hypothetical protein
MGEAEKKLRQLPQDLQSEVEDLIDFLLKKRASRKKKRPQLNWIGGLKEYRNQYTSVERQHKISEWSEASHRHEHCLRG